jgi:hypothetical protein
MFSRYPLIFSASRRTPPLRRRSGEASRSQVSTPHPFFRGRPYRAQRSSLLDQTAAQKARSQPYSRRFFSDHVLTLIGRGIQPQRVPCVGSHPVWSRVFCLSIFCFQNHGRANSRHGSTLAVSAANFDHQTLSASFSIAAALNNIRVLQTFPKGIVTAPCSLVLLYAPSHISCPDFLSLS